MADYNFDREHKKTHPNKGKTLVMCRYCGSRFYTNDRDVEFCSKRCESMYWIEYRKASFG